MNNAAYWFFTEVAPEHPLACLGRMKVSLSAARASLKVLKSGEVTVIYCMPWDVPSFGGSLDEWVDFHLDVLGLREDFPERVHLIPLDVFMALDAGASQRSTPRFDALEFQRWSKRSPQVCELLQALELHADLRGRAPLMPDETVLSDALLHDISGLLDRVAENTTLKAQLQTAMLQINELLARPPEVRIVEDTTRIDALLIECDALRVMDEQRVAELEASRAIQEQYVSKCDALEKAHRTLLSEMEALRKLHGQTVSELEGLRKTHETCMSELQTLRLTSQTDRKAHQSEIDDVLSHAKAKQDVLQRQLHDAQEALELHYLELKAYRHEAQQARDVLQRIAPTLLADMS